MATELRTSTGLALMSSGTSPAEFTLTIQISSPAGGVLIRGTSLTVTGTAECEKHQVVDGEAVTANVIDSAAVSVRLGNGSFKAATATGPTSPSTGQKQFSAWTCSFSPITGFVGNSLTITARLAMGALTKEASITVQVDRTAPTLTITSPMPMTAPMVNGTATFQIEGTASDTLSAVTAVERAIDNGSFAQAAPKAAGAWSEWTATVQVTTAGDHSVAIRARDQEGNVSPLTTVGLKAVLPFEPKDPDDLFGPAAYLSDLLDFAKRRVRLSATGPALQRTTLGAAFHQPFDGLTNPSSQAIARQPVHQARVCVEVLRKYLASRALSASAAAEALYRQAAYDGLLRRLGTSSVEIRLTRVADQARRVALAARLGFDLRPTRPDQLDELLLQPGQITEPALERLFGLLDSTRDLVAAGAPPQPALLTWQLDHLRATWQRQDAAARVFGDVPVPVIDPDLIVEDDLKSPRQGDKAFDLFEARQQEFAARLANITQTRSSEPTPTAAIERLVSLFLAPLAELTALHDRHRRGEEIRTDLNARRIDLRAFLHLMRIRELAVAGTVLDAEWADVEAILLQVQKVRQYATWQAEEQADGVTLGPEYFKLPDPAAPQPAVTLPAWRTSARARRSWRETLRARIGQEQATVQALQEVVDGVEVATLPALRDTLIVATDPANPPDLVDRRAQELMIDLRSSGRQRTSRLEQAIETLREALFAVRIDRFAPPHPAATWELNPTGGYDPAKFDLDWQWFGTHATWRAAMFGFIYPETYLAPMLRPAQDQTKAFRDLVARLRDTPRLTPDRARQEAADYLTALRAETLNPPLHPDLKSPPPTGKPLFTLTELRTESQLEKLGADCTIYFGAITNPHLAPVWLKELFYFVPILLGIELQRSGQYLAAIDWLQCVYAFNLEAGKRKVYHGMKLEANIATQFQRPVDWPRDGLDPHGIVAVRANALTRFAILSLARCFLAFADAEFTRDTGESLPRARGLYETALGLLRLPELTPPSGSPEAQFPPNPVLGALHLQAELNLRKLRNGRNIAGLERQAEPGPARQDAGVVVRLPTPYRYPVLVERAKQLVSSAEQIEAAFLAAFEKLDAERYNLLKARQDLQLSMAGVVLQDLRFQEAIDGVALAQLQQERAQIQADHFDELLNEQGVLKGLEIVTAVVAGLGQFIGSIDPKNAASGIGGALSGVATVAGQVTSMERRQQDWELQLALAQQDALIGAQQVVLAQDQLDVVGQERDMAFMQLDHAQDTLQFMANKFTSADLYQFMATVLERVYAYFLQQATAVAKLAQTQLAFERQATPPSFIQADYWEVASADGQHGAADGQAPDRRGLTGSARLLQDLTRLDQYAFETDRRKLQLTKTISLAQLAPIELQRFRETGVLIFGTPLKMFDAELPGHYLRLVRRVRTSVVALIPPTQGIRATLSTVGTSRVVAAGPPFQPTIVNHGPESVALCSPREATGLFELDVQPEMRLPFEGIGVDTIWRLELPKAANAFDYRTIADVLLTIEYTALDSPEYREQVIRTLDTSVGADRGFSLRDQFPDQWYDLHNPDQTTTPMAVRLRMRREDFPPNLEDLAIEQVVVYLARPTAEPLARPLPIQLHLTRMTESGAQLRVGGTATSTDGLYSTRREAADWRDDLVGSTPFGEWELSLPNDSETRALFIEEQVQDILLVLTYTARTPEWPA